ncbi:MAG: DUF389 domain-containing protein [Bacteroidales bacterium]|nr:DUF389 domain-containing protein [Bacteroidales bacterium]
MANRSKVNYILLGFRLFAKRYLSLTEGLDIEHTIEGIKRDITFRGPTAWILMFSILIASIGLNANSIAVIIGAMLISPLMGPIVGIGLSIGTSDIQTLVRSLKNLGLAVSISLLTSTLYFLITPLNIVQSELLARIQPTILDVLIAFFGGFAGIIAGSRREKTNVIPGVAIATALMPPLCTAGFGLANLNAQFFFGAFYLFFINSVFISVSTVIVVRYLKFPQVNIIDKQLWKRYQFMFVLFLVVTIIPSTVIFYNLIQKTRFELTAQRFVDENCTFTGSELINSKIYFSDTLSVIELYYIGEQVDQNKVQILKSLLPSYGLISDDPFRLTKSTELVIHQTKDGSDELESKFAQFDSNFKLKILEDIYSKNEALIKDKDLKISLLEGELIKYKKQTQDTIPFTQIRKEVMAQYDYIEKFSYALSYEDNVSSPKFMKRDTIPTILVKYSRKAPSKFRISQNKKIAGWMQVRLALDTIRVIEYK